MDLKSIFPRNALGNKRFRSNGDLAAVFFQESLQKLVATRINQLDGCVHLSRNVFLDANRRTNVTNTNDNNAEMGGNSSEFSEKMVPPELAALLNKTLRDLRDSVAWAMVERDEWPIWKTLEATPGIDVKVGPDLRAKLRKTERNGEIEFQMEFESPLPPGKIPFALCVADLDIWHFPTLEWRQMAHEDQSYEEADQVLMGGHCAGADQPSNVKASAERTSFEWTPDGRLIVNVDQPPMRLGQPVIIEEKWEENGEQRHSCRIVSLNYPDHETGWRWAAIEHPNVPGHDEHASFAVTLRPMTPADLHRLDPHQLTKFLDGQDCTVLTRVEGADLSWKANCDDQRAAIKTDGTTWFLRVAQSQVGQIKEVQDV